MAEKQEQDIQKELYKTQLEGDYAIETTGSLIEKTAKAYEDYKDSLLKKEEPQSNIATQTDGVDVELKNEFENGSSNENIEDSSKIKTFLTEEENVQNSSTTNQKSSGKFTFKNEQNNHVSKVKTSLQKSEGLEDGVVTDYKVDMTSNSYIQSKIQTLAGNEELENENIIYEDELADNVVTDEVMSSNISTIEKSRGEKIGGAVKKAGKGMAFVTRTQHTMSSIQTSVEKQDGGKTTYTTVGKKIINKKVRNSKPVKKVKQTAVKTITKTLKSLVNIVLNVLKKIITIVVGTFPFFLPILLAFCLLIGIISCFGFLADDENIFDYYENYIVETNNEYRDQIAKFEEKNEDNRIIGISNVDWQTPLSIIQQLGGSAEYDDAEKQILKQFKDGKLFEVHSIQKETIQVEVEYEVEVEKDGKKVKEKRTKMEDKQIEVMTITNPSYNDYISWLEKNPDVIKTFKRKKGVGVTENSLITKEDKEYIKYLAESKNFYDLASDSLKNSICYNGNGVVVKGDSAIGNKIAELALSKQGNMYLWGGCHSMAEIKNPNQTRFDCSGLVSWAYYQAGANIGSNTCSTLVKKGKVITYEQLQAGDIILYSNAKDGLHHVSIYIGGGKVVHAPRTGKPVAVTNAKWGSEVMTYKRLLDY